MKKRIFVGIHYFNSVLYVAGLNHLFQWVFNYHFHSNDVQSLYQWMKSLKNAYFIYRVPYFSCFFKRFSYVKYFQSETIAPLVSLMGYRHAIFYWGQHHERHDYEVAYIKEFDYQEQLQLLGPCTSLIDLIEIDYFAIAFAKKQGKNNVGDPSPIDVAQALAIRGFYEFI